jgi:hypothetical protein
MKKKFRINIDLLVKVWQNNELIIEFDGTEEELRAALSDKKGDLSQFDAEYLESENIIETEEFLDEFEIQDITEEEQ